jgi:hypothetical protein
MTTRTEPVRRRAAKATPSKAAASKAKAAPPAAASRRPATATKKAARRPASRQTTAAAGRSTVDTTPGEVSRRPGMEALEAIERTVQHEYRRIRLPLVGTIRLPANEELVYYGGVTALVVLGLVDWPVAVLLGVGHELAAGKHRTMVRAVGEALEVA